MAHTEGTPCGDPNVATVLLPEALPDALSRHYAADHSNGSLSKGQEVPGEPVLANYEPWQPCPLAGKRDLAVPNLLVWDRIIQQHYSLKALPFSGVVSRP